MRKRQNEYDERQQIERGKAFRNAFYSLLGSLIICCLINTPFKTPILNSLAVMVFPSMISLSVLITTCILRNAIDGLNYKNGFKWLSLVFSVGGIYYVVISVITLAENPLIIDGVLSPSVPMAFMGICLIEVCIVYWIKHFIDHRKARQMENA